jgi:serine phosphatase RsbU (regulator of sigma subunit)
VEVGEKALIDGFIVTREGRINGIGSGLQLVGTVAEMQAEKNRQIMQSIEYARVIQRAMLRTSREALSATLLTAALVWEPRDVVGGDFYHFAAIVQLRLKDGTGGVHFLYRRIVERRSRSL